MKHASFWTIQLQLFTELIALVRGKLLMFEIKTKPFIVKAARCTESQFHVANNESYLYWASSAWTQRSELGGDGDSLEEILSLQTSLLWVSPNESFFRWNSESSFDASILFSSYFLLWSEILTQIRDLCKLRSNSEAVLLLLWKAWYCTLAKNEETITIKMAWLR